MDGSSSRDYTFIEDIVEGIMAAVRHEFEYDIFNLGNSSPVALLTLIRTIAEYLGMKAVIQWLPEQPGDVPITFADVSKANCLLGYFPNTPFAEGMRKFIDWYQTCRPLPYPV